MFESPVPFIPLRRWWVNTKSGATIAVPDDSDPTSYLLDHQQQFGIDDPHKWSQSSELQQLAAQHGWQQASYDGAQQQLSLQFSSGTQKMLRRIVQQINDQLPIRTVTVDDREIDDELLGRFLRNGRLPR